MERKGFTHPLHKIVAASRQHPDEKCLFVHEEAIKGARRKFCPFGYLLERGFVIALQPKDVLSGIQNILATEFLTTIASSFPLTCSLGWLPHRLMLPARLQLPPIW